MFTVTNFLLIILFSIKYSYCDGEENETEPPKSNTENSTGAIETVSSKIHELEKTLIDGFKNLLNTTFTSIEESPNPTKQTLEEKENSSVLSTTTANLPTVTQKQPQKQGPGQSRDVRDKQCLDQLDNCAQLRKLNVCTTSKSSMEKLCKRTCKFCH